MIRRGPPRAGKRVLDCRQHRIDIIAIAAAGGQCVEYARLQIKEMLVAGVRVSAHHPLRYLKSQLQKHRVSPAEHVETHDLGE
jgi:hypothetical protein